MKVSINLYVDELKPQIHYLSLKSLSITVMLILTTMLLWYGYIYIQFQQSNEVNVSLQQEANFKEQELTILQQALIKHNDKASVQNHKLQVQERLQAKSHLLEMVRHRTQDTEVNYYQVMKDLSVHHEPDLWLTRFNINESQLLLEGYTLKSSAVTRWISYLQSAQSFKGRELSQLNIDANDDALLRFQVASSIDLLTVEEEEQK